MLELASQLVSFVISVSLTVLAARRIRLDRSRVAAVFSGAAVSFLFSIVSDFSFAYASASYDRSFEAVISRALFSAVIGCVVSFFATSAMKEAAAAAGETKKPPLPG